jgi:thioredoxin-dependent peroxiredoxin
MAIEIGRKAPAFTLLDADGGKWALTGHADRWIVVYFYPKADTPGCTTEARDFTSLLPEFTKRDALVVGISADPVPALRKFTDKHALRVVLLSDPDRKVLENYGAWGPKKMYGRETVGVIRSTVLIAPAGKVAFHWPNVKAAGHAEKVLRKLEELQAET